MEFKKGQNHVYVWNGMGYSLQDVTTNLDVLSIEELCYICIKSGKGWYIPLSKLDKYDFELNEYDEIEGFVYVDLSLYGLENGYFMIENLYTENVEVCS